jgi:Activator of Hsp90 ATPase homolog 1-like protein
VAPYAIHLKIDEKEERTTVTLTLKDTTGGTLLTVVESELDKVPLERRFEAFRMNTGGWEFQLGILQRYATT